MQKQIELHYSFFLHFVCYTHGRIYSPNIFYLFSLWGPFCHICALFTHSFRHDSSKNTNQLGQGYTSSCRIGIGNRRLIKMCCSVYL